MPTYILYLDDAATYGVMSGDDERHVVFRATRTELGVSIEPVEIFDDFTAALNRAESLN
jgi:hypothetical protein